MIDPWPVGEEFGLWPTQRSPFFESVAECTVTHHRRRRIELADISAMVTSCRLDHERKDLDLCAAASIERRMAIDYGQDPPIWKAKPGRWYG